MLDRFKGEPALLFSLFEAIIVLAISFGLDLTQEQIGGLMAVVAILTGVAVRTKVSPTDPDKIL